MSQRLRVVWYGIYDPGYPRNDVLMSGLRSAGAEIIECRVDWKDKKRHQKLRQQLRKLKGDYDLVYAAYPASMPVIWAKLLTRKPVVMDALYSMYDALVNDRQEVVWYHPRALKTWVLDWLGAWLADYLIVDTQEHAKYWTRFPLVKAGKIKVIYLGIQPARFVPSFEAVKIANSFLVSFHGHYIPLQGVDKIVEAARLLRKESGIRFRLIGAGQLAKRVDGLIAKYELTNIEQTGMVPPERVAEYCREADVILGSFGDTEKVLRVVPLKVYEGLALGKPVITMDTPAVREIFNDDDLCLIKNTPEALAVAIRELRDDSDKGKQLAAAGGAKVRQEYTPEKLGQELLVFLTQIARP
jgi:glycosyltransferase involved in cell wall biosynthesis